MLREIIFYILKYGLILAEMSIVNSKNELNAEYAIPPAYG